MREDRSRQIWEDIVESLQRLHDVGNPRESGILDQWRQTDPRNRIVGDAYDFPAEEIEILLIDWDEIEFRYEGPFPERDVYGQEVPIESAWKEFVFEKCAWYRSYHYGLDKWGIHINESCWIDIAKKFYGQGQYNLWPEAIKGAFFYIFLHEFFHYLTDVSASIMEILSQNLDLYVDYSKDVYAKTFGSSYCIEEALASRYLYGRHDSFRMDKDYLYRILRSQPFSYGEFYRFVGPKFWSGRRRLMNQVKEGSPSVHVEEPIEQVMELLEPWAYSRGHKIPIWLHIPPRQPRRIFIV